MNVVLPAILIDAVHRRQAHGNRSGPGAIIRRWRSGARPATPSRAGSAQPHRVGRARPGTTAGDATAVPQRPPGRLRTMVSENAALDCGSPRLPSLRARGARIAFGRRGRRAVVSPVWPGAGTRWCPAGRASSRLPRPYSPGYRISVAWIAVASASGTSSTCCT